MNILKRLDPPPLRAGDRMTRDQFLRLWEAHPEIKFAELIGGIVYMPSPLGIDHGGYDIKVGHWLSHYAMFTPGTAGATNATTLMEEDSPQPDLHLRILPEYGGQTSVRGKLLEGSPELVAEICATSRSYDLNQKYDLYEEASVREYVAVLVHEQEIRWHARSGKRFRRMRPAKGGVWKSHVFPGLWLDGKALLAGDMRKVIAVLQEGIDSPEHAELVARLAAAKRS